MSREVKVAIGVLVCIIGMIVYLEINKQEDVVPYVQPIPEVTLVEEPIKPVVPVKAPEPVKPVVPVAPPKVEQVAVKPVSVVAPPVEKKVSDAPALIAPNPRLAEHYVVQKGDTVSIISERELGSIHFQSALMEANPELQPHRLYPGIELMFPSRDKLEDIAERVNSKRVSSGDAYLIQKGDSLYSIARQQLGSPNRVKEIIELNPEIDPMKLPVGSRLKLPKP
jgi:LysM repeat protein